MFIEDYDPRVDHLRSLHDALQKEAIEKKIAYMCILADTNGSIFMLGNVQPESGLLVHFQRVLSEMLMALNERASEPPSKSH
jgi:hypothetical protein